MDKTKSFKSQRAGNEKSAPIPITPHMMLVMEYGLAMTRAETAKGMTLVGKLPKSAGWAQYYEARAKATELLRSIYHWEMEQQFTP
jgi:hypothetical protein